MTISVPTEKGKTMREKLIELLCEATFGVNNHTIESYLIPSAIAEIADHLVANGVTVQKWIPVAERLPVEDTVVLCWYKYFHNGNHYKKMRQVYGIGLYMGNGIWGIEVENGEFIKVLAWMPLPEPPKGE